MLENGAKGSPQVCGRHLVDVGRNNLGLQCQAHPGPRFSNHGLVGVGHHEPKEGILGLYQHTTRFQQGFLKSLQFEAL